MDKNTRNTLDLKGEVCPYTFVKSKLMIEQLNHGDVLEVLVDYQPAASNIPRSMEMEGHEVVEVEALGPTDWKVVVRKGEL